MTQLSASELAATLGLSKARISQLVGSGKLDGCWRGEGRLRRFDLAAAAEALGRRLDQAQMLGNGAATKRAIAAIQSGAKPDAGDASTEHGAGATVLPASDAGRYELARAQKAEEETRRLRRQNALEEGTYVLASEVELVTARLLAQEVAGFETALREGARAIADRLGVDFKAARQILIDVWRAHRAGRDEALTQHAAEADLSPAEKAGDI